MNAICTITLKNIYRLLVSNDYPIYTTGVFSEKSRRGLTLLKFWHAILPSSWQSGSYGNRIWRTGESWNRYHSELCNRKPEFAYYHAYTEEILSDLSVEQFLELMSHFETLLRERNANISTLEKKTEAMLRRAATEDDLIPEESIRSLHSAFSNCTDPDLSLFRNAWVLSMLTILAIIGPDMQNQRVQSFLRDSRFSLDSICSLVKKKNAHRLEILTADDIESAAKPVPGEFFFGRSSELFDLYDAYRLQDKVLITGPHGIGKTELVRQLIHTLTEQDEVQRIAVVHFRDTLADSLREAFPGISPEALPELLHGSQDLLVIDDAVWLPEEAALWQQLADLNCPVFVTSVNLSLPDYQTLPLEPLSPEAAALLFRRHLQRILSEADKNQLHELLADPAKRIPETAIRLAQKHDILEKYAE